MVTTQKIRMFRLEKQLTQQNVADMLDISLTGYAKIEQGKSKITLERLYELAKIFEVEPEEFLKENKKVIKNTNNQFGEKSIINNQPNKETNGFILLIEQLKEENKYLKEELKSCKDEKAHLREIIEKLSRKS